MAFRAFVAVPVPAAPELVRRLEELGALRAEVKPVEPENLHFTLSFLGYVPDDADAPLAEALSTGTKDIAPFEVELRGVGAFPSATRPRVVWVGVSDPRPLVALALKVREALATVGHPGDTKDFRAHLTLGRVKGPAGLSTLVTWLREHGRDEFGTLRVDEARLYRSVLSPRGPTYETVAAARLEA